MSTFEDRALSRINKAFLSGLACGVALGACSALAVVAGMMIWMR